MKCRTDMKKQNKLEDKMLTQINLLEGKGLLAILKWFFRPALKRKLKKLEKDPTFQAAVEDFIRAGEQAKDSVKRYEKMYGKNPPGAMF